MSEKEKIKEELESLAPLLARMKDKEPHLLRAPEGYFKALPDEVLRRIRAEEGLVRENRPAPSVERSGGWLEWLGRLLLRPYAAGLAVLAALLLIGAYLFWPQPVAYGSEEALASVSKEEAAAYVVEHIGEFELELLLEAAGEEEAPLQIEVLPGVGQEEINQYLDEYIEDIGLDELEELL